MALGRRGRRGAARPWSSVRPLTAVFSPLQSPPLPNASASSSERKMTARHPRSSSRSWMNFWPLMDKRWNGRRLQGGLDFLHPEREGQLHRTPVGNSFLTFSWGNICAAGSLGESTERTLYSSNYLSLINERI